MIYSSSYCNNRQEKSTNLRENYKTLLFIHILVNFGSSLKTMKLFSQIYDSYVSIKLNRSAPNAKTFAFSDPTQATKCIL